jgi:ribose transport system permease protein
MALMYSAFVVAAPQFVEPGTLQAILNQAAIPLVLGVGATFTILLGEIDLSVEGVVAATSMIVALTTSNQLTQLDLGVLAVGLAILVGIGMGSLSGWFVTKVRIVSFMATFAMWFIGLGIASWLFDIGGKQAPRILDSSLRQWSYPGFLGLAPSTFIAIGVLILGWMIQRYTVMGRHAYAIGQDPGTAKLSGVSVDRTRLVFFALAGGCYGLAGVMAAFRGGVGAVSAGEGMVFVSISSVVIGGTFLTGGRGGIVNTLIGVLIVVGLRIGLVLLGIDPFLQKAIQGAILLAVVLASTWQLRGRLRVVK